MTESAKIEENYKRTLERVKSASLRSGRPEDAVTLIAVSKTRSEQEILAAYAAGARDFGENKVQELTEKLESAELGARESLKWHMIGHLQRNKVKYIVGKVSLIHSLDTLELAEEIDKRYAEAGLVCDALLQVNAQDEATKFGARTEDVRDLLENILGGCEHIRVRGLMNIAPAADDPEEVRPVFRSVKSLFDEFASGLKHERFSADFLSMGMSGDYEIAIEEGANLVRVGTGIFGPRQY